MFFRLLFKSFARRRSRKVVAVLAVWIGISLVVALLTLGLDVGDKMNRELSSFGSNIKLLPASAAISVEVGGYELAPSVDRSYLPESGLAALASVFWWNNLLGIVPRVWARGEVDGKESPLLGVVWDSAEDEKRAARTVYQHWKVRGAWPSTDKECLIGSDLATRRDLRIGDRVDVKGDAGAMALQIAGIASTGGIEDGALIASLPMVQKLAGLEGKVSEVDISALTTPENKLADKFHEDPKSLTPTEYERWYCTPYPGSVAAEIQKSIPGSVARVVRRVSESQGVVLTRMEGLVALLGVLAIIASALSVMGVLSSAILERRTEVALLRAIGAKGGNVLRLFMTEAGTIGLLGGVLAAFTGTILGGWLVQMIFDSHAEPHRALFLLSPMLGLLTALIASALPVGHTLKQQTAQVLHGN